MGRKPKAKSYRSKVSAAVLISAEERSYPLAPGTVLDEATYAELVGRGFVEADWFEETTGAAESPERPANDGGEAEER